MRINGGRFGFIGPSLPQNLGDFTMKTRSVSASILFKPLHKTATYFILATAITGMTYSVSAQEKASTETAPAARAGTSEASVAVPALRRTTTLPTLESSAIRTEAAETSERSLTSETTEKTSTSESGSTKEGSEATTAPTSRELSSSTTTSGSKTGDTTTASSKSSSSGLPKFTCDGRFFQAVNTPSVLYEVDVAGGGFTNLGTASMHYNAMGYNQVDDYIYAIGTSGGSTEYVRVGSNGQTELIGSVGSLGASITGDVDSSGVMITAHASGGGGLTGGVFAKTDLTTTPPTLLSTTTIPSGGNVGLDMAINPVDGFVYTGIGTTIYRYDPTSFSFTTIPTSVNASGGAQYFDSAGNLYIYHNSAGTLTQFDVTTGAGTVIFTGPDVSQNDGARCAAAPPPVIGSVCTEVTHTGDTGAGSLREAINCANADTTQDNITFNINPATDTGCNSGTGVCTIAPLSALPSLLDNDVVIDGETQSGAQCNNPAAGTPHDIKIQLDGTSASALIGLHMSSDSATIRGLSVTDFDGNAIALEGNDGTIECNHLGLDPDGSTIGENGQHGILLDANGDDATVRFNVISSNNGDGIFIQRRTGVTVTANIIGMDATMSSARPNGTGIFAESYSSLKLDAIIGDGTPTGQNIINHNFKNGISIADNAGGASINGNTINSNQGAGVSVTGTANDVTIIQNTIENNAGLGIDLGEDGVTGNDLSDGDSGPNNLLNYPTFNYVYADGTTSLDYSFYLDVPAGNYRIEFFSNTTADPSGYGEGRTYLGYDNVSHPGGGTQTYTYNLTASQSVTAGTIITATTTEITSGATGLKSPNGGSGATALGSTTSESGRGGSRGGTSGEGSSTSLSDSPSTTTTSSKKGEG